MRSNSGNRRRGEKQFGILAIACTLPLAGLLLHTKDYYADTVHSREHPGKPLPRHTRARPDPHWFVNSTK